MRRRRFVQSGLVTAAGALVSAMEGAQDAFARGKALTGADEEAERAAETDKAEEAARRAAAEEQPEGTENPDAEGSAGTALYRIGDRGQQVQALQQQLAAGGYWLGTTDGGFGHLTQQAVVALQKAHGLSRDGVIGPNVRAALASGSRPSPADGGDHVEVHLASQIILIVRGGSTTTVLNTSTANGEQYVFKGRTYTAVTRPGDFSVWLQHPSGWKGGELGQMWRPMFYSGNYAVHGSRSIPPVPASHGCARVSVAAMDMIWAESVMTMGSRVLVL